MHKQIKGSKEGSNHRRAKFKPRVSIHGWS